MQVCVSVFRGQPFVSLPGSVRRRSPPQKFHRLFMVLSEQQVYLEHNVCDTQIQGEQIGSVCVGGGVGGVDSTLTEAAVEPNLGDY